MAEAAAIRLRHLTYVTSGTVFAAEGPALRSEEGVVTVPVDRPLAALSVWYDGYRINEETGEELRNPSDLDALLISMAEMTDKQYDAYDAAMADVQKAVADEPVVENDKDSEGSDDTSEE